MLPNNHNLQSTPPYPSPSVDIEDYDEEIFKRTLYVGNLHKHTSEYVLKELFRVLGNVTDVKMITHEGQPDTPPYCFVTYETHEQAMTALTAMNGRQIHKMPLKVNWATRPDGIRKDTSRDHHIFVGDLSQEITTNELKKNFEQFGEISEARVVRDSQTNRSKGYGFIAFVTKASAAKAIDEMNNKRVGGREVRTNWATSKRAPPQPSSDPDAVARASSEYNTTVYVGGIQRNGSNDALLRDNFSCFGPIEEIRLFEEKGYGFIKYQTHQAATKAIVEMNGTTVNDNIQLKCRWGKDDHKNETIYAGSNNSSLKEMSNSVPLISPQPPIAMWNPHQGQIQGQPIRPPNGYIQQPYQQSIVPAQFHPHSPYMTNGQIMPGGWSGGAPQQIPYYYPTMPQQVIPQQVWSNGEPPKTE